MLELFLVGSVSEFVDVDVVATDGTGPTGDEPGLVVGEIGVVVGETGVVVDKIEPVAVLGGNNVSTEVVSASVMVTPSIIAFALSPNSKTV